MKLLVACDAHLFRTPDGGVYCASIYGHAFFERYLTVFDGVRVLARCKDVPMAEPGWLRTDGPGVEVYGIPFFQGPKQLLPKYPAILRRLRHAADGCDAAMLRVPGQTAFMAERALPKGMPVALEVVIDLTDYRGNTQEAWINRILFGYLSLRTRRLCACANGVSYVTEETLQRHYPCRAATQGASAQYFTASYSTITLPGDAFFRPRTYEKGRTVTLALSNVSMNSEKKGERTLLRAVSMLCADGFDVRCILIGDGALRPAFEACAAEFGIADRTRFTGLLSSSAAVIAELRGADVYVLPTRFEGLPRGIIEAMAQGLPCLSTPVGGIPELLDADCLFAPDDAAGFADQLAEWLMHPEQMEMQSQRNFSRAQDYRDDVLAAKRTAFYEKLAALAKAPAELGSAR